jgi:psp operon transcriptional activator
VRELRNVVERSVYRWPRPEAPVDVIVFDPFAVPWRPVAAAPVPPPAPAPPPPTGATTFIERVRGFEAALLEEALAAQHHNQRRAAAALGLSYHQLRHYLKKHGIGRA